VIVVPFHSSQRPRPCKTPLSRTSTSWHGFQLAGCRSVVRTPVSAPLGRLAFGEGPSRIEVDDLPSRSATIWPGTALFLLMAGRVVAVDAELCGVDEEQFRWNSMSGENRGLVPSHGYGRTSCPRHRRLTRPSRVVRPEVSPACPCCRHPYRH